MQRDLQTLASLLEELPGVGPRQAKRMVYSLMRKRSSYAHDLVTSIQAVRAHAKLCVKSYQLFFSGSDSEDTSPIERDPARIRDSLMVVTSDANLENIERAGVYKGRYFVLGGTIPLGSTDPGSDVRFNELRQQISERTKNNELSEIILATGADPEGDYTARVIKEELPKEVKISTLGRGLSTGVELEYVDTETLSHALSNRK